VAASPTHLESSVEVLDLQFELFHAVNAGSGLCFAHRGYTALWVFLVRSEEASIQSGPAQRFFVDFALGRNR
jgi:hypothetical protein